MKLERHPMKNRLKGLVLVTLTACAGCDLLSGDGLLSSSTGTPFVLSGTAAVVDIDGVPCRIWRGENGETYHLFQGIRLNNDAFDEIIEPGTTSRLIMATRSDLTLDCQVGVIVEVTDVLEIQ